MAKDLQVIYSQEVLGHDFKIYGTEENPLFLAKDVANWIEHSNPRVMIKTVDEDEKVVNNVYTLGGNQEMWFLTEDGLYEVLMQSRKPIAKQFKKKVKEILKQIRQTGGYAPAAYMDMLKSINDRLERLENKSNTANQIEVKVSAVSDSDYKNNLRYGLAIQMNELIQKEKDLNDKLKKIQAEKDEIRRIYGEL